MPGVILAFVQIVSPPLPYIAVAESFKLPPGANFRGTSGVAFNSKGKIFVIHRGPMPLMEFDPDGNFIRGFGDGLFERSHGLRIDAQDNIWASDDFYESLVKFDPKTGKFTHVPFPTLAQVDAPKLTLAKDGTIWFYPRGRNSNTRSINR